MKKITKSTLKSMVKKLQIGESLTVKIYPCKANTLSIWYSGLEITIKRDNNTTQELIELLDKYINEFEYYNCNNQVGNYASYYIA